MLKLQKQLHEKIVTSFLGMKNLRYGRLSYAHPAMIIRNKDNKKVVASNNEIKKINSSFSIELSSGKAGFYKYQSIV